MTYETITTETQGRVGILRLNRPEKLNAWTPTMIAEAIACLNAWAHDPAIGAIVLTGEGRAFSAGADFVEQFQGPGAGGGSQGNIAWGRRQGDIATSWIAAVHATKPIVVAFNGVAVGMGLTFTLPCAIRLASTAARMSMRFVRVGLIPEVASTTLLPHIVGAGWANEMSLTGRFVSAQEALEMGLVNRIYPPEELLPAAIALAAEIAEGPTRVVMLAKEQLQANVNVPWESAVASEGAATAEARTGPDHNEAIAAFAEKREPRFNK